MPGQQSRPKPCVMGATLSTWLGCESVGSVWVAMAVVHPGGGGMRSLLAQAFLTKEEEGGTPSF